MQEYEFTLTYHISSTSRGIDELAEALGEAGCHDAIAGIGRSDRLALTFDREAESARAAILSALRDARRAIPEGMLIEANPDLVDISETAQIVGRTRQNIRNLLIGSASSPPPVHLGNPSLWHLADLLVWLGEEKGYSIEQDLIDLAEATMEVNAAVRQSKMGGRITDDVRDGVKAHLS